VSPNFLCRLDKVPIFGLLTFHSRCLSHRIFEIAPAAKGLFNFTEGFAEDDDALYENPDFLEHARTVVRMLDATVNMLGPALQPVSNTLEDLGQRHVAYGVLPAHYAVVGEALLSTLEAALGEAWTATVREGWSGIYSFVSSTMIRGANITLEEKKKVDAMQRTGMGFSEGISTDMSGDFWYGI
jgi:hemoglobin-like flavoprotein